MPWTLFVWEFLCFCFISLRCLYYSTARLIGTFIILSSFKSGIHYIWFYRYTAICYHKIQRPPAVYFLSAGGHALYILLLHTNPIYRGDILEDSTHLLYFKSTPLDKRRTLGQALGQPCFISPQHYLAAQSHHSFLSPCGASKSCSRSHIAPFSA